MVINVSIGLPSVPSAPPSANHGADFPVVKKTDIKKSDNGSSAPVLGASKTDATAEKKRYDAVQAASHNFFKDVYAVSDTSFTIYKDSTGQYVTRYTSLRDGKVTYVPEQAMLQYAQSRGGSAGIVQIQA